MLEESMLKGGNRVGITATLIETETEARLWADRFDGSLEDVFDLQSANIKRRFTDSPDQLESAHASRSRSKMTEMRRLQPLT